MDSDNSQHPSSHCSIHQALSRDFKKVIVGEEEQQECSSSVDQQEPEPPPHIKEEQEELWSSQEGEQFQGLEEADITKFPFTLVPVKSEDDEEKAQSSQLHQRQTEENREAEPQSGSNSLKNDSRCKKTFSCSECGKRFDFKSRLQRHEMTHTGEKPFSCSECGKCFTERGTLRKHIRTHTGEKPFSCSVCKTSFIEREGFQAHMRSHTGEKPFSCSECDKRFSLNKLLTRHMRTHRGERPFSCTVCKKSFGQNVNLRIHMTIHTGQRPFSCSFCERGFTARGSLEKHMRIHTGERPFTCSVCKKTFIDKGTLKIHMRVHKGQISSTCVSDIIKQQECSSSVGQEEPEPRPETDDSADLKETREPQSALNSLKDEDVLVWGLGSGAGDKTISCSECGKRFWTKQNLTRHMRTHTGEKPFSCSICKKSFTQSGNVRRHMTTHTGEKPFSCSVCHKTFAWPEKLKSHKCVGRQSSQLHQSQTEENREEEPPASRATQHMETEADGEDCGGPEPARNSHPLLQPETEDQTGDSSEPETDDSADWKETG
ncbi:uncharacterized protein LOC144528568 [Sander vitreus]